MGGLLKCFSGMFRVFFGVLEIVSVQSHMGCFFMDFRSQMEFANLGCVGGNSVEDVDEEEEEDDKEAHSTSNLVHRD